MTSPEYEEKVLADDIHSAIASSPNEEEVKVLQALEERKNRLHFDVVLTPEDVDKLRRAVTPLSPRIRR